MRDNATQVLYEQRSGFDEQTVLDQARAAPSEAVSSFVLGLP